MITGMYHLNIVCTDLDKSVKFYRDILGGKVLYDDWTMTTVDRGIDTGPAGRVLGLGEAVQWRAAYIRFGEDPRGTAIDLLQWIKPASTGKPYDRMNNVGIPRIALNCDDVEKAYKDMKVKGVKFVSSPQVLDMKRGRGPSKVVAAKDPDGVVIELIQNPI